MKITKSKGVGVTPAADAWRSGTWRYCGLRQEGSEGVEGEPTFLLITLITRSGEEAGSVNTSSAKENGGIYKVSFQTEQKFHQMPKQALFIYLKK